MPPRMRFSGITYDFNGYPLTVADQKAHKHLTERDGILCRCNICQWVRVWTEKQVRLRGGG